MKKRVKKSVPYLQRLQQSKQAKMQSEILQDWKNKDVLYEFEMSFVQEQVNKQLNDYAVANNLSEKDFIPEFEVIRIYGQQDLIIAMKMQNILTPEYWEIGIDSHFYNAELDDVMTIPFFIALPEMTHTDLMSGCKLKIKRKGGLKTRWKGLQKEMVDNWEEQGIPENYNLIQSQIYMKAQAHFRSLKCHEEHHQLIARRDQGTLVDFLELKRRVHIAVNEAVSSAA